MPNDLLSALTPAQREAVEHLEGPLLILAGPGSGKTRVITHRVANLLEHGIPARQIVALTFTNKAAEEMRARVEVLAPGQRVWMSTFHRFCARLLRQHAPLVGLSENFTIYDTSDSRQVLRRTLTELGSEAQLYTPERIAAAISWAKNSLITAEQYQARPGAPLGHIVEKVYPAYQARLLASSAVDFDDLLVHVAMLLRENPEVRSALDERFRYIMVDEYQDTNLAQYSLVRALSIDAPNLSVTGDPDQSIYGWRGANLKNILDFEHDYPNVHIVRLEQNYRSTQRILHVADSLIRFNRRRKAKELYTHNDEGQAVALVGYASGVAEAEGIAAAIAQQVRSGQRRPRDFAIFYRVNALSRTFEDALRHEGVPYQMINSVEFYQRREIKDVIGYLQLLNNPRDDNALLRIINTPPRAIGKSTIGRLAEHAAERRLSLLDAARESGLIASLKGRSAVSVAKFVALYDRLSLVAASPVEEILGHVLSETGYRDWLRDSEDPSDQERLANIEELLTAARQCDERHAADGALEAFLEESCLVNDTDDWETESDRVTMMTLHASKGLEFPAVFITALEDGILPHERSRDNEAELEEERRLLFVGITRAREELQLSRARQRAFRGIERMTVPSQFLMELPREQMRVVEPAAATYSSRESEAFEDPYHDADVDFDPSEFTDMADTPPRDRATTQAATLELSQPLSASLTTAAELGKTSTSKNAIEQPRVPPDEFALDMVVRHPDYGLGKIVALSGNGVKRSATVAFVAGAGQRKFMLAQCDLRPMPPTQS